MKFTFKGTELDKVLFCAKGSEANPYKAIEEIAFTMDGPPISAEDRLTFIEENYYTLLSICSELHAAVNEEGVPPTRH